VFDVRIWRESTEREWFGNTRETIMLFLFLFLSLIFGWIPTNAEVNENETDIWKIATGVFLRDKSASAKARYQRILNEAVKRLGPVVMVLFNTQTFKFKELNGTKNFNSIKLHLTYQTNRWSEPIWFDLIWFDLIWVDLCWRLKRTLSLKVILL
jgi:hypothetical protein